ncbi:MAG: YihY/virulence factor BrkB family protein [Bacilli bacterium]|nr:YihY/virulence factor BrkB family protein [Bacilli bacterium]
MKKKLKKVFKFFSQPDLNILPGNIAFYLILSVIPIITLIGLVASSLNLSIESITNFMNSYFPKEASGILVPYISGQGVNLNVVLFTFFGLFLASNGSNAIIVSSNKLYNIENSSFARRRIKAFNLIILLILLIVFMLIFIAFGNDIVKFLNNNFFNGIEKYIYYLYWIIKWPIGIMFIFLIVKLIYTIAPDKTIPSKNVNKGAAFTTTLWIIGTYIYGYYVTNIADYSVFYGNLSSIVILMLWIYFISYVLVLGIIINVSKYNKG